MLELNILTVLEIANNSVEVVNAAKDCGTNPFETV